MDEETRLIRAGRTPSKLPKTIGPPIQRGSTVLLPNAKAVYAEKIGYGRAGLAAQMTLADALAELEGAAAVQLYPSGLAAMTGAMLAVLKAGDEVLVADSVYKPTRRFCDTVLKRFGVGVRYYDPLSSPQALLAMAGDATPLIVIESPGSLSFEVQDVPAIAALAKARGILTLMDNTWAAGLLFKPLAHGVDISVQALTKYVGGHSDLFMGSAAVTDAKLARALDDGIHELGWAVAPEAAYDMLRGLRTLPTRLIRQGGSGIEVADWLAGQPEVLRVIHPALPGDDGHALWNRDYAGACGLFAFVLKPAPTKAVHAFLDALKLFGLGFSWGGFESLAIHCDPQLSRRVFKKDLGGPLIRLHIGLESPADLIADLRAGLDALTNA
ncbi:MAG TPA: cystathionine beta-lyase [Caulobacteraceae bacterium]|nr:cystathionine beta-lyase [Caulobacteraceae bacterium]